MNRSRAKGDRFERSIVDSAKAHKLQAVRVPLSGAVDGFPGDVILTDSTGVRWQIEAKRRAAGFIRIYSWMAKSDVLVIGADRRPALAVLPLDDLLMVLAR